MLCRILSETVGICHNLQINVERGRGAALAGGRFFTCKQVQNDRIKPESVILSASEVSHYLAGSALLLCQCDSSPALQVQNDNPPAPLGHPPTVSLARTHSACFALRNTTPALR